MFSENQKHEIRLKIISSLVESGDYVFKNTGELKEIFKVKINNAIKYLESEYGKNNTNTGDYFKDLRR